MHLSMINLLSVLSVFDMKPGSSPLNRNIATFSNFSLPIYFEELVFVCLSKAESFLLQYFHLLTSATQEYCGAGIKIKIEQGLELRS